MKNTILALALGISTILAIVFYPAQANNTKNTQKIHPPVSLPSEQHHIDVVFVLDTTGSMGGLIDAAKQKIWSIASTMASSKQQTNIRMGLVAYRDRGDAYVTKVVDLTHDLDAAYMKLMAFRAQGGGDGPEDVNQGLYDAVTKMTWNQHSNTYKAIFLVGDSPAHMDYENQIQYPAIIELAKQKDIIVNTIQCGQNQSTYSDWTQIAQLGHGEFFQVEQNGGAVAVKTPYDKKIAQLSKTLEETRLHYGNKEDKIKQAKKELLSEKLDKAASVEAKARRGLYNISSSGKRNLLGEKDLVDDIVSGSADLSSIDKSHLPEPLQALPEKEVIQKIQLIDTQRKELKAEIGRLGQARQEYVSKELAKKDDGKDSLDQKLFDTIQKQAKKKGIEYSDDQPQY